MKKTVIILVVLGLMFCVSVDAKAAIIYDGELSDGVTAYGTVPYRDFDYWYFSGNAGDVVDITVDTVSGSLSPLLRFYSGYGVLTPLVAVYPQGPHSQALISDYTLGAAGLYTVGVRGFSGHVGDYALTLDVSGNQGGNEDPVPEPMTMLLLGPALLGLIGLKRKKA